MSDCEYWPMNPKWNTWLIKWVDKHYLKMYRNNMLQMSSKERQAKCYKETRV